MSVRSPTEDENEGVFKGIRHSRTFLAGIQGVSGLDPRPIRRGSGSW